MCARSRALSRIITDEITAAGPISFARFMDLALYHPEFGYYAGAKIGRGGDYFTNVSVGPIFGRILAGQFLEMWERLGRPGRFDIVEQGAHDGQLASDILRALDPEFAESARYVIVDPSPALRARQEERLGDRRNVSWRGSADESFTGVHFSNELIDALPFEIHRAREGGWDELLVDAAPEGPVFVPHPSSPPLPGRAPGTLAEHRPAARRWLDDVGSHLERGYILIIDYGHTRAVRLAPHRKDGTFSCYRGHRRDDRVLESPGEKDITAHADFTDLAETAIASGLRIEGFTDQHHFLVGAAEAILRSFEGTPDRQALGQLRTLLHPEQMGTQFHYLAFSRGVPGTAPLSGFRHARDASKALFAEAEILPAS